MKKWFKKFLEKLADTNKENFGSGRMDCCEVNQQSNGSYSKSKKK
ncbi:LDCC motif putative metal-binding protein [Anaeromonas frigoriresistens]